MINQKGNVQVFVLVITVALVVFIFIAASASFKDRLFSQLFSKPSSYALSGPNPSPMAKLSLVPSTGELRNTCEYNINIELDTDGGDTDGADVILFFDSSKLSVSSILGGSIYSQYFQNINNAAGSMSVSGLTALPPAPPFNGSGVFATIKFAVKSTASTSAQVNFDFDSANPQKTTDSNVVERATTKDLLTSVTNGSYTIRSGPCKIGDLNGDDAVNVVDFSILLSKWGTSDPVADINGDGIINVVDFSVLLSKWGS